MISSELRKGGAIVGDSQCLKRNVNIFVKLVKNHLLAVKHLRNITKIDTEDKRYRTDPNGKRRTDTANTNRVKKRRKEK